MADANNSVLSTSSTDGISRALELSLIAISGYAALHQKSGPSQMLGQGQPVRYYAAAAAAHDVGGYRTRFGRDLPRTRAALARRQAPCEHGH
jgi:hypothetical protein